MHLIDIIFFKWETFEQKGDQEETYISFRRPEPFAASISYKFKAIFKTLKLKIYKCMTEYYSLINNLHFISNFHF